MNEKVGVVNRGQHRLVVTGFFFLSGMLASSWSSRIPHIQNSLNLTNAELGGILFAIPVGLIAGLNAGSWLVATFGTKRVMLISCIISAVLLVLTAVTTTSVQLIIVLFFIGLARTIYNLSINTASIEVQQQYNKPIISGFHGIWSLAGFIAMGVGAVMISNTIEPYYHFLLVGFIVVFAALFFIRKFQGDKRTTERKPFFVKPDRYLFFLGLMALCAMLCEGAVFDWSVNYFEKEIKADKPLVTAGYLAFISAMTLGRLFGDRLIHRFGIYEMLAMCGLLLAIGFAIVAVFPFVVSASLGFLLIGLGDSILIPVIYMLAAKTTKMPANYALSSVILIGYTGFLIGPLLIGNISDMWGMTAAFLLLSGISLLIVVLSLRVKRTKAEV